MAWYPEYRLSGTQARVHKYAYMSETGDNVFKWTPTRASDV